MRNNWLMTKVETAMFITGVVLVAGGVVWATSGGSLDPASNDPPAGLSNASPLFRVLR